MTLALRMAEGMRAAWEATERHPLGPGAVFGQEEMYLGSSRTASVVAESAGTIYRLSAGALHRMETDDPQLAIALHHFMARTMTERLVAIRRRLKEVMG